MTKKRAKLRTRPQLQFDLGLDRQGDPIRKAYLNSLVEYLVKTGGFSDINVLEVGSWAGASAITWAKAIKDFGVAGRVLCIDFWKPYFDLSVNSDHVYQEMTKAAEEERILGQFLNNISGAMVEDIVDHMVGDSKELLPNLEHGRFQVVFLDGSHLYEDVSVDIRNAIPLVAEGGILCGDDFELRLNEVSIDTHRLALSSRVDFTQDPHTRKRYHPGVTQAVSDIFDEVSSWHGVWAVRKKGKKWQNIDLTGFIPQVPKHLQSFLSEPEPEFVSSHCGFNIVAYGGQNFGLHQSLGEIDIRLGLEELQKLYGSEDIIVYDSADGVRAQIDNTKLVRLMNKLDENQEGTADRITKLTDTTVEAIDEMRTPWYAWLLRKLRRRL
jgi:predicted O-methyltransferase YrrM